MPGGPDLVAFHNECWDYPEPIIPPMVAGQREEGPAEERAQAPEEPRAEVGVRRLYERNGKPPMVWILLPGPIKVLPELRST